MLDAILILYTFNNNPPSKLYRAEVVVPYKRHCVYVCTQGISNTNVLLKTTVWERMVEVMPAIW